MCKPHSPSGAQESLGSMEDSLDTDLTTPTVREVGSHPGHLKAGRGLQDSKDMLLIFHCDAGVMLVFL